MERLLAIKTKEWEQFAIRARFRSARLAELCGVPERQLQRFFKLHMEDTPGRWLRKLRCCIAKDLLARGFSTKSIAEDLRYAHPSHFCREFKAVFRATPQAFTARRGA